ncbi:MFS transporter [Ktedonosporobacter rubrisoli]|uniref:MFS transporter n=1 Tax=Ktedonosporobacter rubrisoli TaxID=2509675 RepID=A0A4P6JPQ6_KTERU|nr:MFS transporter [Ktedonosporobacter rubrisoli]QBD77072.1 MFS transporter [Ktedonosporobacter rubrisoli]
MDTYQKRDDHVRTRSWRKMLVMGLIIFIGINLRTIVLAVPPILPLLRHDLGLSYTQTGLITSLPTLIMGGAALPAGLLIGRLGGRFMIACGLALLALGGFLRALWPALLPLYFFTALLSLGIACSQTAIPSLVRQWFPTRIGFVSALFTDGLVIGETLGAVLTIPVVLGWLGQNAWAASFIFWAVPVVIALFLWLWLAPTSPPTHSPEQALSAESSSRAAISTGHKPVRISAWVLGLLIGGAQLTYFGMNAWIASYNQALHIPEMTPLALGVLNAAQLPVNLAATFFADRMAGKRAPFIVTGVICLIAILGWLLTPATLEPLWAAFLGGSATLVFTLGIALPALLARGEQIARMTGTMLTMGYIFSFLGPFLGGWLWDITHVPAVAFLPVAFAALLLLTLGIVLPLHKHMAS